MSSLKVIAAVVGILGFMALVLSALVACYIWIRRSQYTRERFAFWLLSANVTVVCTYFGVLIDGQMPWNQAISLLEYLQTGAYSEGSLDPYIAALATFVTIAWLQTTLTLFRSWSGLTSVHECRDRQVGREVTMLGQGAGEAIRVVKRQPKPKPWKGARGASKAPVLGTWQEVSPWRDQAKILLQIKRSRYDFGRDSEWRSEFGFWVAWDRDSDEEVAVLCRVEMPSQAELDDATEYLSSLGYGSGSIVLAIQESAPLDAWPGGHIGSLVETVTRASLMSNESDFSEYVRSIRRQVESRKLPDSDLSLKDSYTPVWCTREGGGASRLKLEEEVKQWVDSSSSRQIAILGEYGQGKSTTALMLAYQLLEALDFERDRVPLLIELRGKSPANLSQGELLSAWGQQFGIDGRLLMAMHEAGRLLLIFDGFDEMAFVGSPEQRLRHFQTLWSFNHRDARMIITGRPNLFLDDIELKKALGIHLGESGRPACEAYSICRFDVEDVERALRSWPESVSSWIVDAAASSDQVLELVGRPSLLHVIAVLCADGALPDDFRKLSSAGLMDAFVEATLQRQSAKARGLGDPTLPGGEGSVEGGDPANYMVLSTTERRYFMLGIAVRMMMSGETNQISSDQLSSITEDLALACPRSISIATGLDAPAYRKPISERVEGSQEALGRVLDDVRTAGLLVRDASREGYFRFGHKSFLEFLAADYAERVHWGEFDEEVDSIKVLFDAPMLDVLRTSVARNYFGELVVQRRAAEVLPSSDELVSARLLLEYIVRPFLLQRIAWALAVACVRLNAAWGHKGTLRQWIFDVYLVGSCLPALRSFPRIRENSWVLRRGMRRAKVGFVPIVAVLAIVVSLQIIGGISDPLPSRLALPAIVGLLYISPELIDFIGNFGRVRALGSIVTEICHSRGYGVDVLYGAIGNSSASAESYGDDPAGLYGRLEAAPGELLQLRPEDLISLMMDSRVEADRRTAFFVLALRQFSDPLAPGEVSAGSTSVKEGDFALKLVSRDSDGALPGRDPLVPISILESKRVARKLRIPEGEVSAYVELISRELGWDVLAGAPMSSAQ